MAGCRPRPVQVPSSRIGRLGTSILLLTVLALMVASSAWAHLQLGDGTWTWRYYTRSAGSGADANCENNTGKVDPLNIITYQYGEASRMFDHINGETDWYNVSYGSDQVICASTDGSSWRTQGDHDQAVGHGPDPFTGDQAHYRLFPAGHVHDANSAKFSVADFHHEDYGGSFHAPDESWEKWENHVANEISTHHNVYADYYFRVNHTSWRGFADNGYTTRIGGLHDGNY
jgi:hypothetical protein